MEDQRKRTIIAEIENWRRNHLLPEHYCIFLLNLYTEGDRTEAQPAAAKGERRRSDASSGKERGSAVPVSYPSPVTGKMVMAWLLGALVIAGLILLAFHFNRFQTPMQIAIFACFALVFYILGLVFRGSAPPLTHLFLGLSFVILIAGGVYCITKLGGSHPMILFYLGIICVLLCASAFVFGYSYLLYSGMLGLAVLYGVATIERVSSDYTWWRSELYWVPLACLLTGLGFLMNSGNPKWAGVFAFCGLAAFFGAEIQSLYIPLAKRDLIQLLLFIKVFLASAFFFFTRRYWYSWLRL
ncbi:hypothetical protein [Brevibacillus choshinensis]|uniref:DUF2157 domain-containing protein n=1 Tax=Brevibacillus choshinensis TaxID=54911 RepID=A0ABX7FV35_BRECH|nr:hypothetical protein [Brevibacillus choshinensis]QRG69584.1 hypothetical protein JNE38_10900 [Brevibacillus choshinensis]